MTIKPFSLYRLYILCTRGISSLQRCHHEANQYKITGLPLNSERDRAPPLNFSAVKSGDSFPSTSTFEQDVKRNKDREMNISMRPMFMIIKSYLFMRVPIKAPTKPNKTPHDA